jgi:hypothetical protein
MKAPNVHIAQAISRIWSKMARNAVATEDLMGVPDTQVPYNRLYQGFWYIISQRRLIDEGGCRCQATRKSPSVLGVYVR